MGRPDTGIHRDKQGRWCVDKWVEGARLRHNFGDDYGEAQAWLFAEIAKLKNGRRGRCTFEQAATHYITLYQDKASLELEHWLLREVMPYIGHLYLDQVYDAALQPFVKAKCEKWKSKTINHALGVVRRILNLAARSWRDQYGNTWLATAPTLTMVQGGDAREPYQLTWVEQRRFLPLLPAHLARMALFDLNCGVRDSVVCNLRWEWERRIEDVGCSVFVVPPNWVKGRKGRKGNRVLVCNSVAQSIIESVRGQHGEFVFVYSGRNCRKPHPIETMNNTAWQRARQEAGLEGLHVHDLRHTVGVRLREAGVKDETRDEVLWHVSGRMSQHYAVAQLQEVRAALELITDERYAFNKSLASIARAAMGTSVPTQTKSG